MRRNWASGLGRRVQHSSHRLATALTRSSRLTCFGSRLLTRPLATAIITAAAASALSTPSTSGQRRHPPVLLLQRPPPRSRALRATCSITTTSSRCGGSGVSILRRLLRCAAVYLYGVCVGGINRGWLVDGAGRNMCAAQQQAHYLLRLPHDTLYSAHPHPLQAPPPPPTTFPAASSGSPPLIPPTVGSAGVPPLPRSGVGARYAFAGSYGVQQAAPQAAAAASPAGLVPRPGGFGSSPARAWQPHVAQTSGEAAPAPAAAAVPFGQGSQEQGSMWQPAVAAAQSYAGPAVAPAAAPPSQGTMPGLRVTAARRYSIDSQGSGIQPGMMFAEDSGGMAAAVGATGSSPGPAFAPQPPTGVAGQRYEAPPPAAGPLGAYMQPPAAAQPGAYAVGHLVTPGQYAGFSDMQL